MREIVKVDQPSATERIGTTKFIRPKPIIINSVDSIRLAIETRLASIVTFGVDLFEAVFEYFVLSRPPCVFNRDKC